MSLVQIVQEITSLRREVNRLKILEIQGAGPSFLATRSSSQSINNDTWTKVQFSTEDWDTGGDYDNTTNYRFTPQKAGKYLVMAAVNYDPAAAGDRILIAVYKTGVRYLDDERRTENANRYSISISGQVELNGSTDYIEIYTRHASAGTLDIATSSPDTLNYFTSTFVRS